MPSGATDCQRAIVTGSAFHGRSRKHAMDVTGFALDVDVRTIQGKRCSVVIEPAHRVPCGSFSPRPSRAGKDHQAYNDQGPSRRLRNTDSASCGKAFRLAWEVLLNFACTESG